MSENMKVPGNVDEWLKFWSECGDHEDAPETEPCPLLQKHLDKLVNGKSSAKIFVPLCTKSFDLVWMSDKGHRVVGLEAAESAVKGFFREQKLEFSVAPGLGGKASVYTCKTKNIKVYVADFFDFNKEAEGLFDAVWDRRAMIAIDSTHYDRYVALIKSLLTPDGRCLFVNADFDRAVNPGQPLALHPMASNPHSLIFNFNFNSIHTVPVSRIAPPLFFWNANKATWCCFSIC